MLFFSVCVCVCVYVCVCVCVCVYCVCVFFLTLLRLSPIKTKYTAQKPNCVMIKKKFTTYLQQRHRSQHTDIHT